jgi:uncharacterized protein (TIGR00255 family)
MTGFGAGAAALADGAGREVFAEASSVNRKGLEISVSLPREWNALEGPVGELARAQLHRGAVRIAVVVREPAGANVAAAKWNEAAVAQSFEQLRVLAARFQVPFSPDAGLLLRLAQASGGEVPTPPAPAAWPAVQQAVAAALEQLLESRRREGESLRKDVAARLEILNAVRAEIAPLAPASVARYREGLHARLRQIGLEIDLNDERVLREIALFADRCDIAEELTRLASHLEQFAKILNEDGAVGRKLDFLCQEIHREFNTVGSKAQHLDITRRVLDAKNELERIREQVQNVE